MARREFPTVLELVGGTPIVRLERLGRDVPGELLAKLEYLNPGGSVKDRIGLAMVETAEQDGRLRPGGTIVEPTSGNTGVGLALAAAIKGYKMIFVVTDKVAPEKIALLRAFGAEVVICPTAVEPDSPESYYLVSDRLAEEIPGGYKPDQYSNEGNADAHYRTTGPEIWEQTGGEVDAVVISVGTGGSITGIARYLKEQRPDLLIVGADPEGSIYSGGPVHPYLVEGIGKDTYPASFDPSVVDEYVRVSDRDSFLTTRRLAQAEGILAGGSGGLAVHAALEVAKGIDDPNAMVVVPLPDTGERYLSKVYNDEWMRENQLLDADRTTLGFVLQAKAGHGSGGKTPVVVSVQPGTTVRQALRLMSLHDVSQLPVMDGTNCVGSVSDWSLSARSLDNTKILDTTVSEVMDAPFPVVDVSQSVDSVAKLLSKSNPAVLVRDNGFVQGIVTRSDVLSYLMAR